jgi:hypothetical protein
MDMKRILQAMDGVSTKPVEGSNDMKKFLRVMTEGATPHKVSLPVQMAMQHYQQPSKVTVENKSHIRTSVNKYFREVEQEFNEQQDQKRQLINQYAQTIAERVLMKEGKAVKQRLDPKCWTGKHKEGTKIKGGVRVNNCVPNESVNEHEAGWERHGQGPGIQSSVAEAPIAMDPSEPNNPMIHSHQKANPATLKDRISRARAQLIELAERAQSNDLLAWEGICRDAKGGLFMGLEQNLEQIRHGIAELAAKRRKGGTTSRGIDKHIGEAVMPKIKPATPKAIKPKVKTSTCRAGQTQTGMQTKDGKLVPKCSVK